MNKDEKNETLTFQQQIVLEQLRRNYNFTQDALKSLDTKAQSIISIASIVVSVLSGIRVAILQSEFSGWFFIVIVLYVITMGCSLWTLFPNKIKSEPLKADWEYIYNSLTDPPFDFFYNLLSEYENVIKINLAQNALKTQRLQIAYFFLVITVIAALSLSTVQV